MTLTNWSGNVTIAAPGRWTTVTSLEQLGPLLADADGPVRVLGSRYTYPAQLRCPAGTRGIVLDLPGRGLGPVRDGRLHVTGDTALEEVWQAFDQHGMEPATCPPVITSQTVAGALATGTHAQGLTGGTFSDAVTAIELMDATGTLHRITDVDDDFDAAVLHLGCLGVVVGVEVAGRPATRWLHSRFTTAEDALPEHYAAWNHASAATKSWWFTEQQVAHTWVAHDGSWSPDYAVRHPASLDSVVQATRRRLMSDIGGGRSTTPAVRTLEKFLSADHTENKGTLHDIFRNGIPAPQLNMEIAIPLDAMPAAYTGLKTLLAASPTKLHYPVVLRTTGPARGHLSPTGTAPAAYLGFVSYMTENGQLTAARPLFDDIQHLLYALGGRPHWGKYFSPDLVPPAAGFACFREAVARFDPHARFRNYLYYRTIGLSHT